MSEYKLNYDNDTGIGDDGFWEWWEIERDEHVICKCNDKDDAEEILRILNSHDDLVEALKEARKELDNVLVSVERMVVYFDGDEFHERLAKIDAALAKAEGR